MYIRERPLPSRGEGETACFIPRIPSRRLSMLDSGKDIADRVQPTETLSTRRRLRRLLRFERLHHTGIRETASIPEEPTPSTDKKPSHQPEHGHRPNPIQKILTWTDKKISEPISDLRMNWVFRHPSRHKRAINKYAFRIFQQATSSLKTDQFINAVRATQFVLFPIADHLPFPFFIVPAPFVPIVGAIILTPANVLTFSLYNTYNIAHALREKRYVKSFFYSIQALLSVFYIPYAGNSFYPETIVHPLEKKITRKATGRMIELISPTSQAKEKDKKAIKNAVKKQTEKRSIKHFFIKRNSKQWEKLLTTRIQQAEQDRKEQKVKELRQQEILASLPPSPKGLRNKIKNWRQETNRLRHMILHRYHIFMQEHDVEKMETIEHVRTLIQYSTN